MKKIAIITLSGYFNYGNRLQNYALETILRHLNFDVETIRVKEINIVNEAIYKRYLHVSLKDFPTKCKRKIFFLLNKNYINRCKKLRENNFIKFSDQYLSETEYWISETTIPPHFADNYDYFVVGSDQVWNPNFPEVSSLYFLTFAPKKKRIAYAASFGVDFIPEQYESNYKLWLDGMNKISVREEKGSSIVKKLVNKDVPVLLDPTLLLTKEQWLNIVSSKIDLPNANYVLTYFLGEVSRAQIKQIKIFAQKFNLIIINMTNIKEKQFFCLGPSEFIQLVENCTFLFTDSFHGTVFSVLFEKPFIVYKRNGKSSMYSRIQTLLKTFNLESREIENININDQSVFDIDYHNANKILEIKRKSAVDYLVHSLI